MVFILGLFIILVGGGWLLGKSIGGALFPNDNNKSRYVDKSTNVVHHHHYHDNRSLHVDGEEFKKLKKDPTDIAS